MTRREGAVVGAVGDRDEGFLGNGVSRVASLEVLGDGISCVVSLELGRGRDVRCVSSNGQGGRRSCYVVEGSRREASCNAWNSSQDGSGEVLREIHLEWWV